MSTIVLPGANNPIRLYLFARALCQFKAHLVDLQPVDQEAFPQSLHIADLSAE